VRLIWNDDAAVAAWVAARIPWVGEAAAFGPCRAVGVASEDGRPAAGVVFSSWHPRFASIEIAAASETPRWLTRALIAQIMGYPFDQLRCQRVMAVTPRRAAAARRFLETFGFKREGIARRGFGAFGDAVVFGMLRREWVRSRWVGEGK
jgi:RimJ/RimL family protein N-acetyltransferase